MILTDSEFERHMLRPDLNGLLILASPLELVVLNDFEDVVGIDDVLSLAANPGRPGEVRLLVTPGQWRAVQTRVILKLAS